MQDSRDLFLRETTAVKLAQPLSIDLGFPAAGAPKLHAACARTLQACSNSFGFPAVTRRIDISKSKQVMSQCDIPSFDIFLDLFNVVAQELVQLLQGFRGWS